MSDDIIMHNHIGQAITINGDHSSYDPHGPASKIVTTPVHDEATKFSCVH